jgi:hypothetical protein
MTTDITITTPAGRTLRIDIDTARTLEGVNLSPEEIDEDIDRLIANPADRAEFESECLDGAESRDVIAGWRDYVSEIVVAAEAEARLYAAARAHVTDVISMGSLTAEQIATDAAPLETWDRTDVRNAANLPRDASDEQIEAARVLLANSIRLAARQVQS